MSALIDSSVWIDFTRARSPQSLKRFIAPFVLSPDAVLAEPIVFEVLRYATDAEAKLLEAQFRLLPVLPAPPGLWDRAAKLGRACRKAGVNAGSLDLLIAAIALHHGSELVTFDGDFEAIAKCSTLRLKLLTRP